MKKLIILLLFSVGVNAQIFNNLKVPPNLIGDYGHVYANNSGLGTYCFIFANNNIGYGSYGQNASTGVLSILNSYTGSTGDLLQFRKNDVVMSKFDQNGNLNLSGQTASTIALFDALKNIVSAPTGTYPNPTELSNLKGVTSPIQTQFGNKQDALVSSTNIKTVNGTSLLGSGNLVVTGSQNLTSVLTNGSFAQIFSPDLANYYTVGYQVANGYALNTIEQQFGTNKSTIEQGNGKFNLTEIVPSGATNVRFQTPSSSGVHIEFPAPATPGIYTIAITDDFNKNYTVATLPTPAGTAFAVVTDALAPSYMVTVVGGGSVVCPVFYNGTNWVAH